MAEKPFISILRRMLLFAAGALLVFMVIVSLRPSKEGPNPSEVSDQREKEIPANPMSDSPQDSTVAVQQVPQSDASELVTLQTLPLETWGTNSPSTATDTYQVPAGFQNDLQNDLKGIRMRQDRLQSLRLAVAELEDGPVQEKAHRQRALEAAVATFSREKRLHDSLVERCRSAAAQQIQGSQIQTDALAPAPQDSPAERAHKLGQQTELAGALEKSRFDSTEALEKIKRGWTATRVAFSNELAQIRALPAGQNGTLSIEWLGKANELGYELAAANVLIEN
ncbi:MAG TPA: hypothetical protein VLT36_21910, partial [Candidatus Dormibacteraeota bacterium]|nr:hypothetical protein [Candidatus Dormibacteraeota bacterium]